MKIWLILCFVNSLFPLERESSCPVHPQQNAQIVPLSSFHVRRVAWGDDGEDPLNALNDIPHVDSEGTETSTPNTITATSFDSHIICPICLQPYDLSRNNHCKILCLAGHRMCRSCYEKWCQAPAYDPQHGCPFCRGIVQRTDSDSFFIDINAIRHTIGWGGNEAQVPSNLIAESSNGAMPRDGRCERPVCGALVGMAIVALVVFSAFNY